eukprot:jgi/Botrbrau1/21017/Bobra.0144s0030.1
MRSLAHARGTSTPRRIAGHGLRHHFKALEVNQFKQESHSSVDQFLSLQKDRAGAEFSTDSEVCQNVFIGTCEKKFTFGRSGSRKSPLTSRVLRWINAKQSVCHCSCSIL